MAVLEIDGRNNTATTPRVAVFELGPLLGAAL
jgi:hypothetical protein